jgi:hypothetical protein
MVMKVGPYVFEKVYDGCSLCNRFFHWHGLHNNRLSGMPVGFFLGWKPRPYLNRDEAFLAQGFPADGWNEAGERFGPIPFKWELDFWFENSGLQGHYGFWWWKPKWRITREQPAA